MTSRVLMLGGPVSAEQPSMRRYAQELFLALGHTSNTSYAITLEQPVEQRYVSTLCDHPFARRIDSAWARYVAYPRSIRGRTAGAFHILDHGYSHLIGSLDQERTVITCHDLIPLLASEGVIPMDVSATVARTFRLRMTHLAKARVVIAISAATRDTLERYTPVSHERIVVIPYGINPNFTRRDGARGMRRESAGLDHASKVVLQVATRGRYKNTPVLLKAFAQLREHISNATLVRIGAPFYADESALAEKLGISAAIRHIGAVSDDRVLAEWYSAADVLAFPSLWEGFGWPPLEAMACGTPVVASEIPAIREVVSDAGVLTSPNDPAAMAVALERVLSDASLSRALSAKGVDRAARFTWASAAAGTLAVYESLVQ